MNYIESPVHFEQLEDVHRFFIFGYHPIGDQMQLMLSARFPAKFFGYLVEKPVSDRHPVSAYSYRYWKDFLTFLGPGDYVFLDGRHKDIELALKERGVRLGFPFNLANIYKTYETPTFLHFCKTYLNNGGIAFDVGGNTGLTGTMLAAFCSQVYVFEANPELENVIRSTTQSDENVSIIMKAVSRRSGTLNIYPVGTQNTSAVAHDKSQPMEVPCVSLDAFSQETGVVPDVIKIDVEGVDGEVIFGAAQIIEHHRPKIFLEHPLFNAGSYDTDLECARESLVFLCRHYDLLAYPAMDQLYESAALGMPLAEFEQRFGSLPVNIAAIPKVQ